MDKQAMNEMRQAPKTAATLDDLRARIERGSYEVKPERIAEAMLRRGVDLSEPRAERRD